MKEHLVISLLLSLAAPAAATKSPAGSLVGIVRTSDGLALPGVAVTLDGPAGERRVITGPDGAFRAGGLAAGEYTASVDAPGLALRTPATVTVGAGESRLDLVLAPAPVSERVVVSATRGEATLSSLGMAADVLDREHLDDRAAPSLLPLLQEVPGVATARTGQTGLQASVFIRGGESRYARVLVDGVPVNQPGGAFDFGTALPFELERVEVVRGAASSLYGTDALAGVISLQTRRARPGDGPSLRVEGEGGSFDWQRWLGTTSGTRGRFDWNAGVQRLATDNEQPNSRFEQTAGALSAGLKLDSRTDARAVVRLDDSTTGTPGPTAFGRPDLDASFERQDLVASASVRRLEARLSQRLSLGYARTDQLSLDPIDSGAWVPEWNGVTGAYPLFDFPNDAGFQNQTARLAAGYQADLPLGARHLLTAGGEVEHETGALGNRAEALLRPERTNLGVYLQERVLLGSRAYFTVGGRVERNGSYGTHAVPRAALAIRLRDGKDAATLRASAGMGIKEPSFLESYGESFFAKGNPDLDPERSTTFDLGVEQRLFGSRLRASVTAFRHVYRDQIAYTVVDWNTYEGTYVNLARTRAQGVEVALEARPTPHLHLLGQYTYLDGKILESPSDFDPVYEAGRRLLRRPEHQGSLSAQVSFPRWSAGATLVRVGKRADSDFVGLGLADDRFFSNPYYTRLDARLRVRVAGPVEAFAVAENLLDAEYQDVLGYPALGRAVRGGLRLKVGDGPEARAARRRHDRRAIGDPWRRCGPHRRGGVASPATLAARGVRSRSAALLRGGGRSAAAGGVAQPDRRRAARRDAAARPARRGHALGRRRRHVERRWPRAGLGRPPATRRSRTADRASARPRRRLRVHRRRLPASPREVGPPAPPDERPRHPRWDSCRDPGPRKGGGGAGCRGAPYRALRHRAGRARAEAGGRTAAARPLLGRPAHGRRGDGVRRAHRSGRGANVGRELGLRGIVPLAGEKAFAAAPDIFLVTKGSGAGAALRRHPLLSRTRAVRDERIVEIPNHLLVALSDRAADAAWWLASRLHPARVPETAPPPKLP